MKIGDTIQSQINEPEPLGFCYRKGYLGTIVRKDEEGDFWADFNRDGQETTGDGIWCIGQPDDGINAAKVVND